MSQEEEDPFMALFEEFEAFKITSHEIEEKQTRTIDELNKEIRRLTRLSAESDNAKQQYVERLNTALANEEDLRTEVHSLKENLSEAKKDKVRLENEIEKLSNDLRKSEFTASRCGAENNELADKVIMLEADLEEARAEAAMYRGQAAQMKQQLADAEVAIGQLRGGGGVAVCGAPAASTSAESLPTAIEEEGGVGEAGRSSSATSALARFETSRSHAAMGSSSSLTATARLSGAPLLGSTATANGAVGLHAVAERLRSIADKCRRRPTTTAVVGLGVGSAVASLTHKKAPTDDSREDGDSSMVLQRPASSPVLPVSAKENTNPSGAKLVQTIEA